MISLFPIHGNKATFAELEVFERFLFRDNVYLKTSRNVAMSDETIRKFQGNESVTVVN